MSNSSIPERIWEVRMKQKKTQQEVAEALGVKRETVNQWESGTRQIKADAVIGLSKFFGVSSDYLLGISEAQSFDTDLQAVCKYTGLSGEAVEYLHGASKDSLALANLLLNDNGNMWFDDIAKDCAAAWACYADYNRASKQERELLQVPAITAEGVKFPPDLAYRCLLSQAAFQFQQFLEIVVGDE